MKKFYFKLPLYDNGCVWHIVGVHLQNSGPIAQLVRAGDS